MLGSETAALMEVYLKFQHAMIERVFFDEIHMRSIHVKCKSKNIILVL